MIEETVDLPFDVPLLPYELIKAGDLSMLYEAGNLRYIKYGEIEILRMVYSALRDENWETILPTISNESVVTNELGTTISYLASYNSGDILYEAIFEISIDHHNRIRFFMKGTALSSFKKNRIGICLLHPVKECIGQKIRITDPAGNTYESIFPELISPHQPFKNISGMRWEPVEGMQAYLQLSGDIFETEDQRNWGDDSFKTYSTPLSLPYPARVNEGDQLLQEVILTVTVKHAVVPQQQGNLQPENASFFPGNIGHFTLERPLPLNQQQEKKYRQLLFQHYRLELKLSEAGWQQEAETDIRSVIHQGLKPELVIFFDGAYEEQLPAFIHFITPFAADLHSVLLLDEALKVTPPALMEKGYRQIKAAYPGMAVGYGTDAWFTELNRNPPGTLPHDFVSFCISPQVHATDTRTMIENLRTLPGIIKTARSLTTKPIHVSPITVHKRKNPDATVAATGKSAIENDIQYTSFAAEWILLALPQLAGAASLTIPY